MGRVDYYNDPGAPPANSMVPSVTVAVRDEAGRILLIHKIDSFVVPQQVGRILIPAGE